MCRGSTGTVELNDQWQTARLSRKPISKGFRGQMLAGMMLARALTPASYSRVSPESQMDSRGRG